MMSPIRPITKQTYEVSRASTKALSLFSPVAFLVAAPFALGELRAALHVLDAFRGEPPNDWVSVMELHRIACSRIWY